LTANKVDQYYECATLVQRERKSILSNHEQSILRIRHWHLTNWKSIKRNVKKKKQFLQY